MKKVLSKFNKPINRMSLYFQPKMNFCKAQGHLNEKFHNIYIQELEKLKKNS